MYLTVKQQVKHLSKDDYRNIRELCHIAKNLANQAIYNVRQYYFDDGITSRTQGFKVSRIKSVLVKRPQITRKLLLVTEIIKLMTI
jgi:hypothetical protein